MKIRLNGTAEECQAALPLVQAVFDVRSVSAAYPDRGASLLVRVYVEVGDPSAGLPAVTAVAR